MRNRRKGLLLIDERLRIILVVILSVLSVLVRDNVTLLWITAMMGILMLLSGVIGPTISSSIAIGICCILQNLCIGVLKGSVGIFVLTMLQILPRLLFLRMLGLSLTRTLSIGEMIEALEKMRVPQTIIIPFAVMMRYLPTMKTEIVAIRDSLRIRGIDISVLALLRSPIRWIEVLLVPILMRSVRLADELAATAMVRGLEHRLK